MSTLILFAITLVCTVLIMVRCVGTLYRLRWHGTSLPHWRFLLIGFGNILIIVSAYQSFVVALDRDPTQAPVLFLLGLTLYLFAERRRT